MGKKRILLIDDEDTISCICSMVLEAAGHFYVRAISSGAKALATARSFAPHLIILDWYLMDGHGLDIAVELRADHDLRGVPIVFLTGSLTKDEAEDRKSLGGFPVLSKPISGLELVESALRLAA
jgi:two-component system cell cycle response regulator DivK